MAVSNQQILDFLTANPGLSDAQIVAAMEQYGVSPAQMASAVGLKEAEVVARIVPVLAQDVAQNGLYTQTIANNETGQTEITQRTLPLGFNAYQDESGQLSYSRVDPTKPDKIQLYGSQGEYRGEEKITTTTQDLIRNLGPIALAAGGSALVQGLLGGAATSAAGTVGTTGLTTAELAQLDLALGGAGGTAGAMNIAGLAGGTGAGSLFESLNAGAGAGGDYVGSSLANVGTAATIGNTGMTLSELTQLDMALGGAGGTLGALTLAEQLGGLAAGTLTGGLLTSGGAPITPTTPVTPTTPPTVPPTTVPPVVPPTTAPPVVPPTTVPPVIPPVIPGVIPPVVPPSVIPPAVTSLLPAAVSGLLSPTNIGNLLTTGATTAAGLLQQQTSAAAAKKAQEMIDRETILAKQAAQFKPIGMTTRFGTSQFKVDPITGQLISAGYTLDPQAKNAQDRLVALAESGLQQAEGAQAQYAPLQTGAQSLFGLGNQYLAQSPQDVAQNYLNQQMALLQPGRETELANLQNKLQQQGRGGLSVAQGGTMGATTPELQALYNARAQQEAQLAANAQQYGQQNVLFGAGLLGQGTTAMGNYYAGQQAAYAPYTTALGQVQNLETLAQQPLTMGAQLGQTAAQAGFNVGQLGLKGAGQSVALATSPAATNNPYASALSGLGASNAFGQALGGLLGGGLQSAFGQTGLGASGFGTGLAYGNQDLGLYL